MEKYQLTAIDWARLREWELNYNLDKVADILSKLKEQKEG